MDAASILELLIEHRIAQLRSLTRANGFDHDVGREVLELNAMNFDEVLPHSWWGLDVETPDPKQVVGRYALGARLSLGAAIEYSGREPWRRLLRLRLDLQRLLRPNFPLTVPVAGGGTGTIQVRVQEIISDTPILGTSDPNKSRAYVELQYVHFYETSRNDPAVH